MLLLSINLLRIEALSISNWVHQYARGIDDEDISEINLILAARERRQVMFSYFVNNLNAPLLLGYFDEHCALWLLRQALNDIKLRIFALLLWSCLFLLLPLIRVTGTLCCILAQPQRYFAPVAHGSSRFSRLGCRQFGAVAAVRLPVAALTFTLFQYLSLASLRPASL